MEMLNGRFENLPGSAFSSVDPIIRKEVNNVGMRDGPSVPRLPDDHVIWLPTPLPAALFSLQGTSCPLGFSVP